MKLSLLLAALLLTGCAKHYQVCVVVHDGYGCMHDTLSKPDAVNVGKAMAELGMDVVVKPKGRKIPDSLPTQSAPAHEAPDERTKI